MKYSIGFFSGIGLVVLILIVTGTSLRRTVVPAVADADSDSVVVIEDPAAPSELSRSEYQSPTKYPAVKIPSRLSFAGESVPLADFEVYERLDRELLVNSYWHSKTLQNIKLANRWFPEIEKILARYGLPEDFKYLAVAESGLRNVISPAKATGVWQIMKGTGIEYGMTINSEIDERYDVLRSTEVAAQYLLDGYDRFGSWTLAGASYNMGMPGLNKRLESQHVDNYYDLLLNSETSRYMFRVLAFKLIYENHEQFGFLLDDDDVYHPLKYSSVEVTASVSDLAAYAKEQGTTYKMLKYLNPWLRTNRLSVQPGHTYRLKLPRTSVVED